MVLLKPAIIYKDEKVLVGIVRKINQKENRDGHLLLKVRNEFKLKLESIEASMPPTSYYVVYDYFPEDLSKAYEEINYTYFCCLDASVFTDLPVGMVKKVLPRGKYAVFMYDTDNNTLNGVKLHQSVYDYIDGIWLPYSGFELTDTPDYEVIYENEAHIDYYISIK